ncbi:hypothetical protein GGI21_004745 [Coemansia aciculifera]|uniref:Uncharacterized protein n=1 Tax=Coemansia aciculifera TaxID=417176 RepID=A0ACC1M5H9_9FUNG|nr:hypothetical protein IWW38_002334 [Coemansia aciculifera]KAJ2900770.1 hypothetical protein GGI21_004745 [Coemansia aciculifera]
MSFPSACCNTPPVVANYTTTGEYGKLGDLDCYFAGTKGSKRGLLISYDIFGLHPNVLQLCDILGSLGFYVVLPDLLRGTLPTLADLANPEKRRDFIQNAGSWDASKPAFIEGLKCLRNSGATSVGLIGFCWGAMLVVRALGELEGFVGGAMIHPSMITSEDLTKVGAPLMALLSKDEDKEMFKKGFEGLKAEKSFGAQCHLESFEDMTHGFCAARGDWADPVVSKRASDAIKLQVAFFNDIMPK